MKQEYKKHISKINSKDKTMKISVNQRFKELTETLKETFPNLKVYEYERVKVDKDVIIDKDAIKEFEEIDKIDWRRILRKAGISILIVLIAVMMFKLILK